MTTRNEKHVTLHVLSAASILVACNGLLDNDHRFWDPAVPKGGDSGAGAGGTSNAAGMKSSAGTSFGGKVNSGGAGNESGGTAGNSEMSAGEGGDGATTGEAGTAGRATGGQSSGGQASGGQSGGGQATAGTGGGSCETEPGACTPGDTGSEDVTCGACAAGTATRTRTCESDCTWSDWSEPSECQIDVACQPGQTGMQMQNCGACMTGMQTQTRTCTDSCTWGAWGAWSQCTGVTAACTAGATETRSVACPCSGNKSQRRTCSSTCAWGGWTDTSSCNLECCSEIVYCNTPNDISPASRGTWCRRTDGDCTNAQVSSDCMEDITMVCGSVTPTLYIEY
jgi:hypothetical protein